MNKFIDYIIHPFVVAGFISILLIWGAPNIFDKYEISRLDSHRINNNRIHCFHDLNNNGNSDDIYIQPKNKNRLVFSVFVKDHVGRVLEEWPIQEISFLPNINNILFSDINNNQLDEICFLGYNEDSVFLYALEPYSSKFIIERRFIQKVNIYGGQIDANVYQWQLADLNNDGYQEVLFNIFAGYSLQPRGIYAYDFKNDSLWHTSAAGNMLRLFKVRDIDDDGKLEIYGDQCSTGNCEQGLEKCNDSIPYTDYASWIMVFDNRLAFKYPPIIFFGLGSWNQVYSTIYNGENCLMVFSGSTNSQNPKNLTLNIYSLQGENLFEKKYDILKGSTKIRMLNSIKQVLIFDDKGCVYSLQNDYKLKLLFDGSDILSRSYIEIIDLNNDGSEEVIISMKDHTKMMLFDKQFKHPVIMDINDEYSANRYISINKNNKSFDSFALQIGSQWYHFEYKKNLLYRYRFLFYISVYLIMAFFFYGLFVIQQRIIKKRYEIEKQLTQYQFRSLRNQFDPHFSLNILNLIQSLFYLEDFDKAKDVLGQYLKLNRTALMNADKITISVKNEMEFVKSFLKLQRYRFNESFDFEIRFEEETEEIQIPRMLVYSFVENALKCGIRELINRKGNLIIAAQLTSKLLIITVEDNGIGRKKAKEKLGIINKKGDAIIMDIVVLYNKLNNTNISYQVSDVLKGQDIAGTKVEIYIPLLSN